MDEIIETFREQYGPGFFDGIKGDLFDEIDSETQSNLDKGIK